MTKKPSDIANIIRVGGYEFDTDRVLRLVAAISHDCDRAIAETIQHVESTGTPAEAELRIALAAGFAASATDLALAFGSPDYREKHQERAVRRVMSIVIGIAELATENNPICQE